MSSSPVFELNEVRRIADGRTIVDVSRLEIRDGELFTIVGPSGAGKSTLLRLLHFLEAPEEGEIRFFGKQPSLPAPVDLRRRIGMLFQQPAMLKTDVWHNVNYPLRLRQEKADGKVDAVLKKLNLAHLKPAQASTLSGGELQRVALARLIVSDPDVFLLDEPTANLDPHNVELIEAITRDLIERGKTVVLVTHNVFQARRLAQRVGLMLNSKMVEISETEKFFESPGDPRALSFVRGEMVY